MAAVSSVSAKGPFKFMYFPIEGAGEKVRLTFVLAGVEFEDVRVPQSEWMAIKPTTKFGQLPMLKIGEEAELAQSPAMMKYISQASEAGKKLYPMDDPLKCVLIDEMMALCADMNIAWAPSIYMAMRPQKYAYPADIPKEEKEAKLKLLRETFLKDDLPRFMGYFTKALEANDFLCGPEPTLADCWALPLIRYYTRGVADYIPKDCLEPFPAVTAYVDRMLALPAIAKWYEAK